MKKVLLSLLLAVACMPMAIGQSKASHTEITDTTVCGRFTWTVNNETYSSSTSIVVTRSDTAFFLNLNVLPATADTTTAIPVEGVCVANWNNKEWKTPGNFYDTLTATNGCDSIVKIAVSLDGYKEFNETIAVCDTFMAPWGTTYNSSTTLENDTIAATYCNYVVTMNLTVNASVVAPTTIIPEAGCTYSWQNLTINDSETYYDTLTTAAGCDSVISVQVTSYTGQSHDTVDIVACDSYVYAAGDTLTTSQMRTIQETDTTTSCEYFHHFNITIVNSHTDTTQVVVRDTIGGCSLSWLGENYTYSDTNRVIYGLGTTTLGNCDSLMAIRITAFSGINRDTTYVDNCGRYRWAVNGTTYETATLDSAISTINGCRQIDYLSLTTHNLYDTVNERRCGSFNYVFLSRSGVAGVRDTAHYTESGTYTTDENNEPLYSKSFNTGCETYHTLILEIVPVQNRNNPDTIVATVCDAYSIVFGNENHTFESSVSDTTLIYSNRTVNRCYDTLVHLNITVNYKSVEDYHETVCNSYFWPFTEQTYTASTTEEYVLPDQTNVAGCDSIGRLNLTVNYTPDVRIDGDWHLSPDSANSTVLTAVDNAADNNTYRWYRDNATTPFSTDKSVTVSNITANTDIRLETTSDKGCSTQNWITITYNLGIDDAEGLNVNLYPNPASRYLNVESAEGISEVTIYNAIGQQVIHHSVNANATQLDLGNLATGHYTLSIRALDGSQATRKFIVNK